MNVLSLFDGMSCGQIALKELGIPIEHYYASEIDQWAIKQTQYNFPNTIQLGDVRNVCVDNLAKIDLLIGGSPCQGFSVAGEQLAFDDPRSVLFFEYVRILHEVRAVNPNVKFLLENVRMKKEFQKVISDSLGLEPVTINSALVSAQNRVRLYWTNIRIFQNDIFGREIFTAIPQPKDRGLVIRDVIDREVDEKYFLSPKTIEVILKHNQSYKNKGYGFQVKIPSLDEKAGAVIVGGRGWTDLIDLGEEYACVPGTWRTFKDDHGFRPLRGNKFGCVAARARQDGSGQNCSLIIQKPKILQLSRGFNKGGVFEIKVPTLTSSGWERNNFLIWYGRIRRLTPTECARLQTIPNGYRWRCSETQQYKLLGNGWTVEVIKHIFSYFYER